MTSKMCGQPRSRAPAHRICNLSGGHSDSSPQNFNSSASLHRTSSAHTDIDTKPSRKPAFRVFQDEEFFAAVSPSNDPNLRLTKSIPKSGAPSQVFVHDKENQVPPLDARILPRKPSARHASIRTRVLRDKTSSKPSHVNSVTDCDPKIHLPSASCKTAKPSRANTHYSLKTSSRPAHSNHTIRASESKPLQQPSITTLTRPSHTLDTGLNELVSKLQALQTHENIVEQTPVLDPLPADATCPGAPKIPSSFMMPLFAADDYEADKDRFVSEFKSKTSHQMSPLAEVTEAYTGSQGGWSPPLQSASSAFKTCSFHTLAISPGSVHLESSPSIPSGYDLLQGKALGISLHLDNVTPSMPIRRDVSSSHASSGAPRGSLRI